MAQINYGPSVSRVQGHVGSISFVQRRNSGIPYIGFRLGRGTRGSKETNPDIIRNLSGIWRTAPTEVKGSWVNPPKRHLTPFTWLINTNFPKEQSHSPLQIPSPHILPSPPPTGILGHTFIGGIRHIFITVAVLPPNQYIILHRLNFSPYVCRMYWWKDQFSQSWFIQPIPNILQHSDIYAMYSDLHPNGLSRAGYRSYF